MRSALTIPAAILTMALCQHAAAQPKPPDPDWPCQQLLVPTLSAGSYWDGPAVRTGDTSWRDDPKMTELVENVVNRDTPDSEAAADLTHYAASIPKSRRAAALTRLYGFIVDEANDERSQVIDRIDNLSRRQQALSKTIDDINRQIAALPATAPHEDLLGQRDFNIQTFQDAQHTVHYACEVPGMFDQRLGLAARTLLGEMGK